MTNVPKEKSVEESIKDFYSTESIPEEMKQAIAFMRQWLNEDRKATPMVTARDLWHWLEKSLTTYRQDIIAKRDEEIVESVKFIKTREMNVGENRSKYLAFQRGENHMKVKVLKLTEQSETDFCKKLEAEGKDTFQVAKALAELRNHPTKDTDQSLNNKKE